VINKELEVAEWLIENKEGIEALVKSKAHPAYQFFPDKLFEIYTDAYAKNVINIIKKELEASVLLNPEEVTSFVTPELITAIFGSGLLKP